MSLQRSCLSRFVLLPSVALAGAALLVGVVPLRGQENRPTVRVSAPASAAARGSLTEVALEFSLPPGHELEVKPRFRITSPRGRLAELLPAKLTQAPPSGKGVRRLLTDNYNPGVYQVRAELLTRDTAGRSQTTVSPPVPLAVPTR